MESPARIFIGEERLVHASNKQISRIMHEGSEADMIERKKSVTEHVGAVYENSDFCNLSGNSFNMLGSSSIGPQNEKLLDSSYMTQTEEGNRLINE